MIDDDGLLRLYIGYNLPPKASELTLLLQSFSNSFNEFSKEIGYPDRELVVRQISSGSISFWFDIIDKIGAAYELAETALSHRHHLTLFCQQLAASAQSALSGQPLPGRTQLWRALGRLADPIKMGEANVVTAKVKGANGAFLEITGKLSAEQIAAIAREVVIHRPTAPPDEPVFPQGLTPEQYFEQEEDREMGIGTGDGPPTRFPLVYRDARWFVIDGKKPKIRSIIIRNMDEKQAKQLRQHRRYTVTGRIVKTREGDRFIADWGSITRV
ncbi:hypothetical protein FHT19_004169 [Novosphingobium sp. SG919]|nr:hypothetical protein [Novosphingobium sp. SG919]